MVARSLEVGREVLVQGVATKLTYVEEIKHPKPAMVWEIPFTPDWPIEAGQQTFESLEVQAVFLKRHAALSI